MESAASGLEAEGTELTDGASNAAGAIIGVEVAAALEEAVNCVLLGGGALDGEVIVGGEHGRVD